MAREVFIIDGRTYDMRSRKGESDADFYGRVALRKRDIENGRVILNKGTLVKAWAKEYLEAYREPSVGSQTYRDLCSQNRCWIEPIIGNMIVKDVKPLHCQKILNSMAGLSKTHIKKVRQLLFAMFDVAQDNRMVEVNPAKKLKLPVAESGTHRAITDSEREALIKVCQTHKYGLWAMIMLYCGLRPGETSRVMGHHVNLKDGTLYIDGTKSKAAKRTVPLPEPLAIMFKKINLAPFQPVFKNEWGNVINRTKRRRMWEAIERSVNVEKGCKVFRGAVVPPFWVAADLVPYCLRHTYGTDLQAAGVPINVAKVFLGHSDISTTGNIYTHESETAFNNAAKALKEYHQNCHEFCHEKRVAKDAKRCIAVKTASIKRLSKKA